MKRVKNIINLLIFGMLVSILGCRSEPQPLLEDKPFGDIERTPPSINQEAPEVMAQKMFEADRNEAEKIGPLVLRSWREKSGILILDLMNDETRTKYGALKESQRWDGKKAFKVAKNTPIVLVASVQDLSLVQNAYRRLEKQGYTNLYILNGGIEAWSKIYGQR